MRIINLLAVVFLLFEVSALYAWSGKIFSVNGKTITVATSDSAQTQAGVVVYIVADGKEIGRGRVARVFHTKVEIVLQNGQAAPGQLVTDVKPVVAGTAKKAEAKLDAPVLPNQNSTAVFANFCGLKQGDSMAQLVKVFGQPTESENESQNKYTFSSKYYFDKKFEISLYNSKAAPSDVGKVMTISIKSAEAVQKIKSLGIKDSKLNLWGLHHDEILKRFGKPASVVSDSYEYRYESKGNRGVVRFYCYPVWGNKCNEITVQWLRNQK